MESIAESNNDIIRSWIREYLPQINAEKRALGIKHRRYKPASRSGAKTRTEKGEINRIGIGMSKGEVMTHKGKGKYPDNRVAKPWFNPITEREVEKLADSIAANTGDRIAGHILIP